MAWNSPEPRRSGAFIVEIVERAPQNIFKEGLDVIKEKIASRGGNNASNNNMHASSSTAAGNNNAGSNGHNTSTQSLASAQQLQQLSSTVDEATLRPGDFFRLRSVKFPDFELGLTSVKLRDEYCYLGLRKVEYTILYIVYYDI